MKWLCIIFVSTYCVKIVVFIVVPAKFAIKNKMKKYDKTLGKQDEHSKHAAINNN